MSFAMILADGNAPPAIRQRSELRMAQVAASEGKTEGDTAKGDAAKSVGSEVKEPAAVKPDSSRGPLERLR